MKKQLLFLLLTLVSGTLLAQKNLPSGAAKTAPPKDPTQLQGPPPDTEPPAVVCLNGLPVNLFQTGEITLWASDFLLSVSDNVTPENVIKIGIRKAGSGTGFPVDANGNPLTSVTFNCNELGQQPVELWAIDEAGNADYCEAFVLIEDNFSHCNQAVDTFKVCFNFACDGAPMVGLPINIYNCVNFVPAFQAYSDSITGPGGCATIVVQALCDTYVIAPEKDDNPKNGLSTYDLFLISKHIIGTEPLDNPYKLIAADANKSGSITTFDLVELRKLIMGIYSELPNNTSWRFIDGNFVFPNPLNPFGSAFPETISLFNGQMTEGNFVGVKIGDVDCTASIDSLGAPADFPDALLAMPDTLLLAGQVYEIPISMAENGLWSGYQFALNWDAQKLEFQSMALNNETSLSNWNTLLAQQGSLTTSWFQYDLPVAFGPDDPIATIRFKALQTVSLKDAVFLNKDQLYPEGYAGPSAEKKDLVLTFLHQFKPSKSDLNAERNLPSFDPTQLQPPPLDVQAPVISCLNGLSVNLMATGSINLWASDFLLSVSDNMTPTDQIKIGVRKCGTGTGMPLDNEGNPVETVVFDCNEQGDQCIELWAMDAAGNADYCESNVLVQDNLGNCPVTGKIKICNTKTFCDSTGGVEEIIFRVTSQILPEPPVTYFDLQNDLCFEEIFPLGLSLDIAPVKDDNPLNGVSTYDLVLLSKHIYGIEPFTEPWQWVAADANRDGQITLEDSVVIRKLILGEYTDFPGNTSWRFVLNGYQFPSPDPLSQSFPESFSVPSLQDTSYDISFMGIKIGDLNCSAVANFTINAEERAEALKTQRPNALPSTGPMPDPYDPTQLGDFAPPTIVCLNGLSVNIMPTGSVSLWATDFLQYTQDNATPVNQIKLGVRIAGTGSGFPLDGFANPVSSLTLTCAMVDSFIPIELWAMDASGNAAFCTTHVLLQDASGNCAGSNGIDLHLCARVMCSDAAIETAIFEVHGSVNFAPPFSYFDLTDTGGCLDLVNNVPIASTFKIKPTKDDNPLNGMDEQDFILLSKHINGTQPFTDPWQWVAADANRDGLVTLEDSVAFRNLALGIYTELPYNTSWRFVPQGYQFPSPDPLSQPLPEFVTIASILTDMDTVFMGIKIGDLDCSAIPNFAGLQNEQRNQIHQVEQQAEVSQPRPNPTSGSSFLPVYMPFAEAIHLEINDIGGRLIWSNDLKLDKGDHLLEIPASAMPLGGVYLWRLRAGKLVKSGKLVRL
jgi:hypothetical protein